jgi:uncharacterized protein involved in outer membrane biogenesis
MKWLTRRHVLMIAGAAVLFGLVLVVVGLEALKSDAVKHRIEATLSGALGQPVTIGTLGVSLFPAPALSAKKIRVGGSDSSAAPGLALAALHVAPDLLSLLPGRTKTINAVDLDGLVVSVRHTATGQWLVPGASSAAASAAAPAGQPPAAPSATGPPTPPAHAAAAREPNPPAPSPAAGGKAGVAPPLAINLNALRVRNGAVRVVDDSLRTAAGNPTITTISNITADLQAINGALSVPQFSGQLGHTVVSGSARTTPTGAEVSLASKSVSNADLPALFALAGMQPYPGLSIGGQSSFDLGATVGGTDLKTLGAAGHVAFGTVQFGTIAMQNLRTPFRLEKGVVTLDPVTFMLYSGQEQGAVSIDMAKGTPSYAIKTAISGLDVNQALSANTTMKNFLLGTARMSADVHASGAAQPEIQRTLTGTTKFAILNGDVRNMPMLATVNQVLGITGGSSKDTKFESLTGTAALGGGKATTNDLTLHAGDLSVLGKGTMAFDQAINMAVTVTVAAAKMSGVGRLVGLAKPLQDQNGNINIPGTVTGTASNPKIALNVIAGAKKEAQGIGRGVGQSLKKLFH